MNFSRITRLFLVLLLFSTTAFAQMKLGHINSLELLSFMPGVKAADAQLETYAKQLDDQNSKMVGEYEGKVQEYQSKESVMMDAIKEVKLKEIADLQERIQNFQVSAQDKLAEKRDELISPILEKAEKAIQDVAKEKGYTYIFDTSSGAILHFDESNDVMALVKTKLNIQ